MVMDEEVPKFFFDKGDLEISLTYYYFLGNTLSASSNIKSDHPAFIERASKWKKSHAAHDLRESFIDEVIVDHFHLDENAIFGSDTVFEIRQEGRCFKFSISPKYLDGVPKDYSGAIECYLFRNGHLSITIKLVNEEGIDPYETLLMIREPELSKSEVDGEKPGAMICYIETIIGDIEEIAKEIFLDHEINCRSLDNTEDHRLVETKGENFLIRSIPYIGVIFRFKRYKYESIGRLVGDIEGYVIAAARTTPSFFYKFDRHSEYLKGNNRNIYSPGKSIVFIAKRGWCVFDSREQESNSFSLSVIESTYFTIIYIASSSRSWARFNKLIKAEGKEIYSNLNRSVIRLVSSNFIDILFRVRWVFRCHGSINKATSFIASARNISPASGQSRLFEAHMMSHTARAAVKRCEELSHLKEIESVSRSSLSSYSDSLKIASSHFQSKSFIYRVMFAIISIVTSVYLAVGSEWWPDQG